MGVKDYIPVGTAGTSAHRSSLWAHSQRVCNNRPLKEIRYLGQNKGLLETFFFLYHKYKLEKSK